MTMDEIRASDKDVLTPKDVAGVLDCDPQWIRLTAEEAPEKLGFRVTRIGTRTKIPRLAFIAYMEGRKEPEMKQYYFTYAEEGHPYSGGWTEVQAETMTDACAAFRSVHPDKKPDLINCAGIYTKEQFARMGIFAAGNYGKYCVEIIYFGRNGAVERIGIEA